MVKKYLAHFTAVAGKDIFMAAMVLLALGLMEGIGLMMIIPFLAVIGISEQQINDNPVTVKWFELAESSGLPLNLVSLLVFFVLLIALREYVVRLQSIQTNHIQQKIINHFRSQLYRALVYSNYLFFTRERSSEMTQTLTADINRIGLMVLIAIRMASTGVLALVYFVGSLLVSIEMTLITMASALLLLWASRDKFTAAHRFGGVFTDFNNKIYALIGESLTGIKTAKCFSAEHRQVDDFNAGLDGLYQLQSETNKSRANAKLTFGLGTAIVLAVFILVAVEWLNLSSVSILLLVFLFSRLSPKVSTLQQDFLRLLNTLPALESYDQLLIRAKTAQEQTTDADNGVVAAPKQSIALRQLSFSYVNNTDTLTDIELNIPVGQSIAIIGPSGSGKSTIADILMGLIFPKQGGLYVDGYQLNQQQLLQWRKHIGYVPQDTHFFHASIRDNLLWSEPEASEEQLIEALIKANALDFVMALPQGLDTLIGDRGICLSGGERQRLALARALLTQPTLLILDEATSALDENNQTIIMEQLNQLKGQLTMVMITHRLTTLNNVDVIYRLADGKLRQN